MPIRGGCAFGDRGAGGPGGPRGCPLLLLGRWRLQRRLQRRLQLLLLVLLVRERGVQVLLCGCEARAHAAEPAPPRVCDRGGQLAAAASGGLVGVQARRDAPVHLRKGGGMPGMQGRERVERGGRGASPG